MRLDPRTIPVRAKLMIVGLYLSKFDSLGLRSMGFGSFKEAFNVLGYALGERPASIKNYRDEFDPYFSNPRKGWHKRPTRASCREILDEYRDLDLGVFTALVNSFAGVASTPDQPDVGQPGLVEPPSTAASRMITGMAAEKYFQSVYASIPLFVGRRLEDTTLLGCGHDFRLHAPGDDDFLAVEVKGLRGKAGSISFTPREYEVARSMGERFILFVAKNFVEAPTHEIIANPAGGALSFAKREHVVISTTWTTSV